jgi:type I restriction enzyme, S subunit
MSLVSYPKYKECNSESLGFIPAEWSFNRIKDVASVNTKSLNEKTPANYTFKYIDIGNVDITGLISEPEVYEFKDAPSRARRIVKKHDVIISTVRTYLKAVAYFKENVKDTIVSTGFAVLSSNKKVIPAYLSYFVQSETFITNVIRNSVGVSYPAINSTVLSSLFLAIPTNSEQQKITQYLDAKIGAINRKINALGNKILKYEELKNAVIQEKVLRGLNRNAKLKYSGYDWIGEIPVDWDIVRLTDYSSSNKRTNQGLKETNLLSLSYGNIVRKDINTNFGLLPASFEGYQIVKEGYIILRLTDLQNDKKSLRVGLVKERGIITSAYLGLIFNKRLYPPFCYYLLHCYDLKKVFYWEGGSVRQSMKFEDFKTIPLFIPSLSEQVKISEYLNLKSSKIDLIIANIKQQIEDLKKLRISLINEVVTGKSKIMD